MQPHETECVTAQVVEAEPLLLGIPAVAQLLGISAATVRRNIDTGTIPSVRLGGRRLVPYDALKAFVASLPN